VSILSVIEICFELLGAKLRSPSIFSVKQMKALMEDDGGGIRLWDDLFEKAWQYHDLNHLTITEEVADGVKVTHEVNDGVDEEEKDCVVAIIHEHAAVVSKFITNGMSEAHSNHLAPAECNGL
jgi:uncharacterized protein YpmB